LEYAYAVWNQLPRPEPGRGDELADFRHVNLEQLRAFAIRRLEAMEHFAGRLTPNPCTSKSPFVLPDLAGYED
jgi:hypothetical protein